MGMFARHRDLIGSTLAVKVRGRVCEVRGLTITAKSLPVPTGTLCRIEPGAAEPIDAQVVGFSGDRTLLMPLAEPRGVTDGDAVVSTAAIVTSMLSLCPAESVTVSVIV